MRTTQKALATIKQGAARMQKAADPLGEAYDLADHLLSILEDQQAEGNTQYDGLITALAPLASQYAGNRLSTTQPAPVATKASAPKTDYQKIGSLISRVITEL